jgi:Tfp pilus assembly protein PilO
VRLLRRILSEKRLIVVPLALAVVANVVAYAVVVRPLQARVNSAEERRRDAEENRRAAARDLAQAQATETGKQRAEEDLQRFYRQILPGDFASARRAVYVRLAQLARECNLRYERQSIEQTRDSRTTVLTHLRVTLVLDGSYEDVRRFLHAVETAPEFFIVDTVGLAYRGEANAPLMVTLGMSTYFRAGADHET